MRRQLDFINCEGKLGGNELDEILCAITTRVNAPSDDTA